MKSLGTTQFWIFRGPSPCESDRTTAHAAETGCTLRRYTGALPRASRSTTSASAQTSGTRLQRRCEASGSGSSTCYTSAPPSDSLQSGRSLPFPIGRSGPSLAHNFLASPRRKARSMKCPVCRIVSSHHPLFGCRAECLICLQEHSDLVSATCGHVFCTGCVRRIDDEAPPNVEGMFQIFSLLRDGRITSEEAMVALGQLHDSQRLSSMSPEEAVEAQRMQHMLMEFGGLIPFSMEEACCAKILQRLDGQSPTVYRPFLQDLCRDCVGDRRHAGRPALQGDLHEAPGDLHDDHGASAASVEGTRRRSLEAPPEEVAEGVRQPPPLLRQDRRRQAVLPGPGGGRSCQDRRVAEHALRQPRLPDVGGQHDAADLREDRRRPGAANPPHVRAT